MKVNITKYLTPVGVCQQAKAEHKRMVGLLKSLEIPEWNWEHITMDFVVGLPRTPWGKDAIWFVVDRLTKSANFIPMKLTNLAKGLVPSYMKEVLRLHDMPNPLFLIRTVSLCTNFGCVCMEALGIKFSLSVVFQSKHTIQTLEDMLRACVLSWKGNWEDQLALIKFAYNNSYHASIKMTPYESLYGWKCISPLCWVVPSERLLVGPDLMQQTHAKVYQI
jgi:hypothetical protein